MVVGRLTNEGRRREQAMAWSAEAHGLASSGGSPSFFVAFLSTAYNFAAVQDGPNPAHDTCALIRASTNPDPIMATSRYSGNAILWSNTTLVVSVNAQTNVTSVTFAPGYEPLVLVTDAGGLANVGGFLLAVDNTMSAGTKVLAIFPGTAALGSVPFNNRIRLRSLTMFSAPL